MVTTLSQGSLQLPETSTILNWLQLKTLNFQRAERAKERRKHAIERREIEVPSKRKYANLSSNRAADIYFTVHTTSAVTGGIKTATSIADGNGAKKTLI